MARVRSPNYPALSLPEAISRVKTIHDREQHLAAPKEVIAKHLGYGGLNGASNKVLSAISKYGLLEEVAGDKVKVSSAAISILFPHNPEEKASAIKDAALKPPLFAEIFEEWQGSQPSDENLRSYLIRRNFASDALDRVIQAYRETMELVTRESGGYIASNVLAPKGTTQEAVPMQSHTAARQTPPPPPVGEPFRVSFSPGGIDISGRVTDLESADELVRTINALKLLLKPNAEMKKADAPDQVPPMSTTENVGGIWRPKGQ